MEKFIEVLKIIMSTGIIIGIVVTIVGVFAGAIAYCRDTSDQVKFPSREKSDKMYAKYMKKFNK